MAELISERRALPAEGLKPLILFSKDVAVRPGLAFLSITALFCLSLEAELLQQIDSFRLYLTTREILLEAGIALLLSLAIACCWWVFVLLVAQPARVFLRSKGSLVRLYWNLWIAAPLAYLILEAAQDIKLEILPRWHAGTNVRVSTALVVSCLCVAVLSRIGWPVLWEFCRTRLVPIAWAHFAIALVAATAVLMHGVHLFHDYEHPAVTTGSLASPDIYLISIDTLRAEDTSLFGYSRATTPNLEKFAQRSFNFDYYFANSNFTTPATSSIETGKLPWSHRVFHGGDFLRGQNQHENLPAVLKQRGYYTAMITSNFLAAPFRHRTMESYDAVQYASPNGFTGLRFRESNLIGVNTQYTLTFSLLRGVNLLFASLDHFLWSDRYPSPAEDVFGRASRFLEQHDGSKPIFLWTHILPPHDPYFVPPPYRHRFVSEQVRNYENFWVPDTERIRPGVSLQDLHAAYDEMMLYADQSVGDFLDWLSRTGRLDRSIVIVTADHGELFDHGRLGHGGRDLYQGLIHIPLLIHLPRQTQGVHIDQLAQQADLLPTLLDLAGTPAPSWVDGASLRPTLESRTLADRYIYSMNLEPNSTFHPVTKGTVAVMDGDFKFVRYLDSGKEQLYRYKTDKDEENNLLQSEPEIAKRMRNVLLEKLDEVNRRFSRNQ
ncbi:MAG: sulfatase [Candidatus Sulfotelmatobacter sp.]|jgi:arylsulfatase A-like enzyme